VVLDVVLVKDIDQLGVIEGPVVIPEEVRVFTAATYLVDAVDLTRLFLRQLHEDDRSLGDDSVDHQCR